MAMCYQKHPFEIDSEDRLTTINTKIFEIKKKIQLSEGQRKSNFEENEAEKQQNSDLIETLKKEVRLRLQELAAARQLVAEDEVQVRRYLNKVCPIGNKSTEQLLHNLDLKVTEQRKILDLLKYERKAKKTKLKVLEKEYEHLLIESSKSDTEKIKYDPMKKHISHLENEIHKVLVQWNEAELVKKKYSAIRKSLLDDSVKFESSLTQITEMLKRQKTEIAKLEQIKEEASEMRARATAALLAASARAADAEHAREAERAHFEARFEERKRELEKLEKRIFPPAARAAPVRQDSSGSIEGAAVEEISAAMEMEDIFQKLMKLTGVTEAEQVFDRFRAQRETCKRLSYLQQTTEEEKLRLETAQTKLMNELEAFKFASVKDKDEAHDKIAELKEEIQMEELKISTLRGKQEEVDKLLDEIKKLLYNLCKLLEVCPDPPLPEWTAEARDVHQVVAVLTVRFEKTSARVQEIQERRGGVTPVLPSNPASGAASAANVSAQNTPREPEVVVPTYKELLQKEPVKLPGSDEEEDIPSRSYLKRQAQLILDTKSRRKGFRPPYRR